MLNISFFPLSQQSQREGRVKLNFFSLDRLYLLAVVGTSGLCWMEPELMGLVHPLPKPLTLFIKDFGPRFREEQLLAARKLQGAETSSIVPSDSCKTVCGVCAVSVNIYIYVFSPTHI